MAANVTPLDRQIKFIDKHTEKAWDAWQAAGPKFQEPLRDEYLQWYGVLESLRNLKRIAILVALEPDPDPEPRGGCMADFDKE